MCIGVPTKLVMVSYFYHDDHGVSWLTIRYNREEDNCRQLEEVVSEALPSTCSMSL